MPRGDNQQAPARREPLDVLVPENYLTDNDRGMATDYVRVGTAIPRSEDDGYDILLRRQPPRGQKLVLRPQRKLRCLAAAG